MTETTTELIERLRYMVEHGPLVAYEADMIADPALVADALEELSAEVERLRDAIVMAVAEMMRAAGRLEIIAMCNEDRRIVAALSGTCDFARAALEKRHD